MKSEKLKMVEQIHNLLIHKKDNSDFLVKVTANTDKNAFLLLEKYGPMEIEYSIVENNSSLHKIRERESRLVLWEKKEKDVWEVNLSNTERVLRLDWEK